MPEEVVDREDATFDLNRFGGKKYDSDSDSDSDSGHGREEREEECGAKGGSKSRTRESVGSSWRTTRYGDSASEGSDDFIDDSDILH